MTLGRRKQQWAKFQLFGLRVGKSDKTWREHLHFYWLKKPVRIDIIIEKVDGIYLLGKKTHIFDL